MLPEITSALQIMSAVILLLVTAVAVLGVVAFRLHQYVRALYEHLQSLDYRTAVISSQLTDLEHFVDAEYAANTENRGGSRDA